MPTDLTPEHLAAVAEEYAAALECGQPPSSAISARWSVPVRTAQRWAGEARSRGLLADTRQGVQSGRRSLSELVADELGTSHAELAAALRKHGARISAR